MKAKVLVNYGPHKPGDIIDVVKDNERYLISPTGDRCNLFYPSELELLPDDGSASLAGGPSGAISMTGKIRTFDTGATRDTDAGKFDYEGFLSPLVLERYAQYLNKHRVQSDGKLRDSDNWQKGIPKSTYIKSAFRHFIDWWKGHRATPATIVDEVFEDSMMALLFNVMGYAHEYLKEKNGSK